MKNAVPTVNLLFILYNSKLQQNRLIEKVQLYIKLSFRYFL